MNTTDFFTQGNSDEAIGKRACAILAAQVFENHKRTDRLFGYLLIFQWLGAVVLSLIVSPRVWAGTVSQPHIHLFAAVLLGACIISLPVFLAFKRGGHTATRHFVAAGQVLLSALLIHITGGRIETHFHIFGSLAFLACYRDWKVLLTASAIVAADHLLRGLYWPQSVYGVLQIEPWRWLEHTAWVAFEDAFLIVAIRQSVNEMRHIATQQAELEQAHQKLLLKSFSLEASEQQLSERLELAHKDLIAARDAALESSRLKSEFLANMSHEIRTPMNAVIGMTDILYRSAKDKTEKDRLSVIRDAGQGLLTIIGDILDFSKIEAGKMVIELSDLDVLASVEGTAELLGAQARAKGIALLTYVDPSIPKTVYGDAGRMRQILINLIGNAIKFTDIGRVSVKVRLHSKQDQKVVVKFSIEDTGIGLSEAEMKRLFSPFVQADGSSTRKYSGTGLGLSICKRLVELMGGDISVESTRGKGSIFYFTLPFEYSDEAVHAAKMKNENLIGKRVLVVDDDPVCCEIMCLYLEQFGIESRAVSQSNEVMKVLQAEAALGKPYDIALLDLFMPGMDALELHREIEQVPEIAATDLILVTAFDKQGQGQQVLEKGFRAYLRKPIKMDELFCALLAVITRRDASASELLVAHTSESVVETLKDRQAREVGGLILLAEDHPANQMVAQIQLSELGFATHVVNNGSEAIAATSEHEYQLILMDCMMPETDGFQATAAIRHMELTTGRHVPIIAMTARAMPEDQEKCLSSGMDGYLSKPVELDQLRAVLDKWLPRAKESMPACKQAKPEASASKEKKGELNVIGFNQLAAVVGKDRLEAVLTLFISETRQQLKRMALAIEEQNDSVVLVEVHRMRGASGALYCSEMHPLCISLEKAAESGDWVRTKSLEVDLQKSFVRLEAAVEMILSPNIQEC